MKMTTYQDMTDRELNAAKNTLKYAKEDADYYWSRYEDAVKNLEKIRMKKVFRFFKNAIIGIFEKFENKNAGKN